VHGPLVEEIKEMLRSLQDHSVKWARRSANEAAHKLAKEGCILELIKSWFIVPPSCIENSLATDLAGLLV
jgi:hypothetical protein